MAGDSIHVVMLPWLAFGHMIPFFQLSLALAKAGIRVSFISTPKNTSKLPKIPSNLESLLKFVDFQLPAVEGLPAGAEATVDVTNEEIQFLKVSYDMLDTQFKNFVSNDSVDWIITDFAAHWMVDIALEFGIRRIMFSVYAPVVISFFGSEEYREKQGYTITPESMTSPPPWIDFPSAVAYRKFEVNILFHGIFGSNDSKVSDAARAKKVVEASQAIAIRSCNEYDGVYLDVVKRISSRRVIPIGFLPQITSFEKKKTTDVDREIFQWLDQQQDRSVVYVGFGSEVKLSRQQVCEIAHGLELANLPFLWALRKPDWAVEYEDALPPGFSSRTATLGRVFMGWVPQLDILCHPSVGGALFHSGWGTIIEMLQHGHTLIVLPLVYDQGLNARLLVEKGLAVEVERSDDGGFCGQDISNALRKAMVDEEGESLRARAMEMKSVFSDQGLHYDHYLSEFVKYLKAD